MNSQCKMVSAFISISLMLAGSSRGASAHLSEANWIQLQRDFDKIIQLNAQKDPQKTLEWFKKAADAASKLPSAMKKSAAETIQNDWLNIKDEFMVGFNKASMNVQLIHDLADILAKNSPTIKLEGFGTFEQEAERLRNILIADDTNLQQTKKGMKEINDILAKTKITLKALENKEKRDEVAITALTGRIKELEAEIERVVPAQESKLVVAEERPEAENTPSIKLEGFVLGEPVIKAEAGEALIAGSSAILAQLKTEVAKIYENFSDYMKNLTAEKIKNNIVEPTLKIIKNYDAVKNDENYELASDAINTCFESMTLTMMRSFLTSESEGRVYKVYQGQPIASIENLKMFIIPVKNGFSPLLGDTVQQFIDSVSDNTLKESFEDYKSLYKIYITYPAMLTAYKKFHVDIVHFKSGEALAPKFDVIKNGWKTLKTAVDTIKQTWPEESIVNIMPTIKNIQNKASMSLKFLQLEVGDIKIKSVNKRNELGLGMMLHNIYKMNAAIDAVETMIAMRNLRAEELKEPSLKKPDQDEIIELISKLTVPTITACYASQMIIVDSSLASDKKLIVQWQDSSGNSSNIDVVFEGTMGNFSEGLLGWQFNAESTLFEESNRNSYVGSLYSEVKTYGFIPKDISRTDFKAMFTPTIDEAKRIYSEILKKK